MQKKRGNLIRTGVLAAVAIAALLIRLFPQYTSLIKWAVILLGVAYLIARALTVLPTLIAERRRRAAQVTADVDGYADYSNELRSLRSTYAIESLADGAPLPPAYADALAALNEKHRQMLTRKFGAY